MHLLHLRDLLSVIQNLNNLTPELAHAWHPVALSSEVTQQPLQIKLLGETWVLVRTSAGLTALRDLCPHRNAPLSAGCVVNGALECPYHGWRFAADGQCVGIPAMGDLTPPRSAAARTPAGVQERYGLVWLAPKTPKAPLIEIPEWTSATFRAGAMPPLRTRASAAQVVDNFLDVTHFYYLHGKTFGLDAPAPIDFYRVDRSDHEVVLHHQTLFSNGSGPLMPRVGHYHCTLPYQCRLVAEFPGTERLDMIALIAQPEDAHTTRIYKLLAYNWASEAQLAEMVDFETRVIGEDVAMAELLPAPDVPLATVAQAHARGDEIGLAWRHAIQRLFSGPTDIMQVPAAPVLPVIAQDTPADGGTLALLWASQTGQAEALAMEAAARLQERGIATQCLPMDQCTPERLAQAPMAVLVSSTFGDGDPPDNGTGFWQRLAAADMPRLDGLRYAVLGVGDRSFDSFCAHGQRLDDRLRTLGAQALAPRADVEQGERDAIGRWIDAVVAACVQAQRPQESPTEPIRIVRAAAPAQPSARVLPTASMAPARLVRNRRLGDPEHERFLSHCVVDLAGTDLRYETGDLLRVLPQNPDVEVQALLESAQLRGEEPVEVGGHGMTLRDALRVQLDLRRWGAQALQEARGAGAQALADRIRPLQPRRYSIASSPDSDPCEVHLLVTCQSTQGGLCSSYLSSLEPGAELRVSVQSNPRFRLPQAGTPIIMVGAGSGLAPFRGFLQERRARGDSGRNWLFFGERYEVSDFHFREEFEALCLEGRLTRLETAFSRDQAEPVYVQHRMLAHGAEVWDWMQQGAVLYVCGSLQRLARGVDDALVKIAQSHGGLNPEGVAEYWAQARRDGRYLKDVY